MKFRGESVKCAKRPKSQSKDFSHKNPKLQQPYEAIRTGIWVSLSVSKRDANGGERMQALPLQERGERVRHFHGNLSGVCLVPGDNEQQRRREVDERERENSPR